MFEIQNGFVKFFAVLSLAHSEVNLQQKSINNDPETSKRLAVSCEI